MMNNEVSPAKDLTIERMSAEDSFLVNDIRLKDRVENPKNTDGIIGIAVIRDTESGEVVGVERVRENLVVRTGREYALRKLFNLPPTGDTLTTYSRRMICAFGVGSGGTPSNNPQMAITPTPADSNNNTPVPFKTSTALLPLSPTDLAKYITPGEVITVAGIPTTHYFYKRFTGTPIISTVATPTLEDPNADEYYVRVKLEIDINECRNSSINEISLYTGMDTTSTPEVFTDLRIFSRITFATEYFPLTPTKGISVDYYIYC